MLFFLFCVLFLLFCAPEVFDFSSHSSRAFSRHVCKSLLPLLLFPWPLLSISCATVCVFVFFRISGIQDVFFFSPCETIRRAA